MFSIVTTRGKKVEGGGGGGVGSIGAAIWRPKRLTTESARGRRRRTERGPKEQRGHSMISPFLSFFLFFPDFFGPSKK